MLSYPASQICLKRDSRIGNVFNIRNFKYRVFFLFVFFCAALEKQARLAISSVLFKGIQCMYPVERICTEQATKTKDNTTHRVSNTVFLVFLLDSFGGPYLNCCAMKIHGSRKA